MSVCVVRKSWMLMQVREIKPIPFVLLGDIWNDLLTQLYGTGEFIAAEHMTLWKAAKTPEEAIHLLQTWAQER
jgi:thiamine monophosphate synthase